MENIYSHRMGTNTLEFTDADGKPLKNIEVTIHQTNHKFLFGGSEFTSVPFINNELDEIENAKANDRFEKFTDIFNFITLPFYWGRFEPTKGEPDTIRLKKTAEWLKEKGCVIKGHPLCWHTSTAPWLLSMSNDEILKTQLDRIRRDVTDFTDIIDMWDVINEAVIMPIFDKYDNGISRICKDLGRIELIRKVFAEARGASQKATLLINDFDTSEAYDILIEGLLGSGIAIEEIGIQSHMHQGYWGVEKTREILERFSRFNLPIHFTETSLVSGHIMPPEIEDLNDYKIDKWPSTTEGEERQAAEAELHYKTLFAHPLVKSITWWSFSDGLWLGAPSGLITKEGDKKPAYEKLHKLIKEDWWTKEQHMMTDENGRITLSGYLGEYVAACRGSNKNFTMNENNEKIKILM